MENEFVVDLAEVFRVIDTVEVLLVRFDLFDPRLLVDARCTVEVGPLVKVVPRAGSLEERLRSLRLLRPQFPLPERLQVLRWPRHLAGFIAVGIWQRIVERCQALGNAETPGQCEEALVALQAAEREAILAAIQGEGYKTLWERR